MGLLEEVGAGGLDLKRNFAGGKEVDDADAGAGGGGGGTEEVKAEVEVEAMIRGGVCESRSVSC